MVQQTNLQKITSFINDHPSGVLGTVSPDNTPHGAVVYFYAETDKIYFVTKNETQKYTNLLQNHRVSITVFDPDTSDCLQAVGNAYPLHDAAMLDKVIKTISGVQATAKTWLPPISKLRAGSYMVVAITLTSARLADYDKSKIGDPSLFTTYPSSE